MLFSASGSKGTKGCMYNCFFVLPTICTPTAKEKSSIKHVNFQNLKKYTFYDLIAFDNVCSKLSEELFLFNLVGFAL